MKIYSKKGDSGKTSLFGGTALSKNDIRIEAYGTVDELNSSLGFMKNQITEPHQLLMLDSIQKNLFNIGSHLASDGTLNHLLPTFEASHTGFLEEAIDHATEKLPKLTSFILPEGAESATRAHLSRSICRRAERRVIALHEASEIDPTIIVYLNRLSDYLFTLARELNHEQGVVEKHWTTD